jgi:hypothetical protein
MALSPRSRSAIPTDSGYPGPVKVCTSFPCSLITSSDPAVTDPAVLSVVGRTSYNDKTGRSVLRGCQEAQLACSLKERCRRTIPRNPDDGGLGTLKLLRVVYRSGGELLLNRPS